MQAPISVLCWLMSIPWHASEPVAAGDDEAAADRRRHANLLSGAIARAARTNKPLVISTLQVCAAKTSRLHPVGVHNYEQQSGSSLLCSGHRNIWIEVLTF